MSRRRRPAVTEQASFSLRGRNPDVLTCIANLSNDEVFTPPEFANRMLDTLAEAWAASHNGANIWADKTVKFLDPFTKSGVFLREITTRLTKGLEKEIPELEKRVNHILTRQVFGIGITHLTSLLARRSVYCSKHANGQHSIAKVLHERRRGTSGSSASSTHGLMASALSVVPAKRDLGSRRGAGNPRLRVHSHRQHQDSDNRVVWRQYAIRCHHWQPAVSDERRRVWHERLIHLSAVRGAGEEAGTALSVAW